MNEVKTTVCGTEYHLLFNGYAMFAAQDMFENRQLGEIVQDNTAEGFVNLCRVFCLLAEQGELARRYEGYDRGETPDEERLRAAVMPYDVIAMRQSVLEALMRGYKRDVPEEETDLGLAELQKKKNRKAVKADYLRIGAVNGLGVKETLLLPVGVVFDLLESYARAHRPPKQDI